MKSTNLIFLISQPRSGSTLLQAIIAGNNLIDTISEPWILLPFLSIFKPELSQSKYNQELAMDAVNDFLAKQGLNESFREEYREILLDTYSSILSQQDHFVLDKTPRYYEIIDLIHDFFPDAKKIVLKRNPIAVFSSIIKTWQRKGFDELAKHHHRDLFYGPELLLEAQRKYSLDPRFMFLKYEEILSDPDMHYSELCDWLGINSGKLLINKGAVKGKYGDPIGIHHLSDIDKNNINKWEGDLKHPEISSLISGYGHFLGEEFLECYGYPNLHDFKATRRFNRFHHYSHHINEPLKSGFKRYLSYRYSLWKNE